MDEYYVINLLRDHLSKNESELNEINDLMRVNQQAFDSRMALETYGSRRKELRGQISALRQSIAVLEKEFIIK